MKPALPYYDTLYKFARYSVTQVDRVVHELSHHGVSELKLFMSPAANGLDVYWPHGGIPELKRIIAQSPGARLETIRNGHRIAGYRVHVTREWQETAWAYFRSVAEGPGSPWLKLIPEAPACPP